jgi:uncharacterized coiled-coil protein SlyX
MPQINVELTARTVEAVVTLNVSHLNDLLRIVIDQSNAHEAALQEHKAASAKADARIAALESELDRLRPDGDRVEKLAEQVADLRQTVDVNRDTAETRIESLNRKTTKRLDSQEATLREEVENSARRSAAIEQHAANASAVAKETQLRLAQLKMPDMGPINDALATLQAQAEADAKVLAAADLWLKCWSAGTNEMHNAVHDDKAPEAAKIAYVLSRPPLVALSGSLKGDVGSMVDDIASQLRTLQVALTGKLDKSSISDLLQELNVKMAKLTEAAEFVDRRMKTVELLPARVGACESLLEALRHGKADLSTLDLKANESELHGIAEDVTSMRDEFDDLLDRLKKGAGSTAALAASKSGAQPNIAAGRRASVSSNLAAGALEDVKKRLIAVEGEARRLEKDKADKLALVALNDLIEALDGKLVVSVPAAGTAAAAAAVMAGGTGPAAAVPSSASRTTPVRTRSPEASAGLRAALTPLSPSAPAVPQGTEKRPPRNSVSGNITSPATSRPGSSRRSPPRAASHGDSRPPSARVEVKPMVTPISTDPHGSGPGNSWHLSRGGSVSVRDCGGYATTAVISGGHVVPYAVEQTSSA